MNTVRLLQNQKIQVLLILSLFFISKVGFTKEPSWERYSKLLLQYVSIETHEGISLNWVDYSGLKSAPEFTLLKEELAEFPVEQLVGNEEKLAFYINTYNIFAMDIVLKRWPVESIKDLGSLLRPVWKREISMLNGRKISLHEIEHEILIPIGDSRIHMAIVCASISCPDLRQEPYIADKLNDQLDDQAKSFLANRQKGLVIEGLNARSSKIFDWFEEDFVRDFGSVDQFFYTYSDLPQSTNVKYNLPYNWSVNGD